MIINDLTVARCEACEGGVPPLTEAQVVEYKSKINSAWEVSRNKKISRTFTFKNFKDGLEFVNKIGALAEAEGHHPDLQLSWGRVQVQLWTHAVGGLSPNDFIMAAKIDRIEV